MPGIGKINLNNKNEWVALTNNFGITFYHNNKTGYTTYQRPETFQDRTVKEIRF